MLLDLLVVWVNKIKINKMTILMIFQILGEEEIIKINSSPNLNKTQALDLCNLNNLNNLNNKSLKTALDL